MRDFVCNYAVYYVNADSPTVKKKSVFYILRKNLQEPCCERVDAFCKSECVPAAHPTPNERHARLFFMPVSYWNITDVKLEGKLL